MATPHEIVWLCTCMLRNNLLKLLHVLKSMADHLSPCSTRKDYSATNSRRYMPFMLLRKQLQSWQRAVRLFALAQQLNETWATALCLLTCISKTECLSVSGPIATFRSISWKTHGSSNITYACSAKNETFWRQPTSMDVQISQRDCSIVRRLTARKALV